MKKTQNDLSYNEAKIDYEALLLTCKHAYYSKLQDVRKYLNKCDSLSERLSLDNKCEVGLYLNAEWLRINANALVTIGETLHTLAEARNRENINIINKGV